MFILSRKQCLEIAIAVVATVRLCSVTGTAVGQEPTKGQVLLARPTAAQYTYHEQERIMFVCLDPCTWQGREYDNHSTDLRDIKLSQLDVDQWCRAALAWGAKEILLVAKHTGGFCWWQTKTSNYSVAHVAWKQGRGDLVDEVAAACGRHGLKLGMYIYPGDDQWGAGIGSGGRTRDPARQEAYNKVLQTQWAEVLARHRDIIIELWFDGSCYVPLDSVLEKFAGDRVVYFQGKNANLRWVGNEAGIAPYPAWNTLKSRDLATGVSTAVHSDPDGDAWAGLECDTTLYDHHWFWSPEKEKHRKSLEQLLRVYYQSVGRGATLLLNSTPNTDGLIPDDDMALYKQYGKELTRRFQHPLGRTSGRGPVHTIAFDRPTRVNQFMIMEDYRQGHRIREFVVEGRTVDGQWVDLNRGTAVGRKRVVMFDPVTVTRLALRITRHVNEPIVRNFFAYFVEGDNRFLYETTAGSGHDPGIVEGQVPGKKSAPTWTTCGRAGPEAFKDREARLELDISRFIDRPGQFLLRVDDLGRSLTSVEDVSVTYDGHDVHENVVSTLKKNEIYLLNRQAQVVDESKIVLILKLKNSGSSEASVQFSIRRAL